MMAPTGQRSQVGAGAESIKILGVTSRERNLAPGLGCSEEEENAWEERVEDAAVHGVDAAENAKVKKNHQCKQVTTSSPNLTVPPSIAWRDPVHFYYHPGRERGVTASTDNAAS
jgi:hypothetical protein